MTQASNLLMDQAVLPTEFFEDIYHYYHELREEDPVHWSEPLDCWILTRYDDVVTVLKDWRRLSSVGQVSGLIDRMPEAQQMDLGPMRAHFGVNGLINSDPPQHTRLRTASQPPFLPAALEKLRPEIQAIVDGLLDSVQDRDEFDMINDFAYLLPTTVIAKMLGVPIEDRSLFNKWVDEINSFLGTPRAEYDKALPAQKSLMELRQYYQDLREARRAEPREDMISWLNAAQDRGDIADDGEFLVTCVTLLTAGYETTMNLIGNSIHALLRNPDQLDMLRNDLSLIDGAVEELLRYESPVQRRVRTALEDVEIAGHRIRKGQLVVTLLGAANRDPKQFADPDRLDITRPNNRHIAFGVSRHLCIGAPLARLEGHVAIPTILKRFPNLRLADKKPQWRKNVLLRGLTSMPVAV